MHNSHLVISVAILQYPVRGRSASFLAVLSLQLKVKLKMKSKARRLFEAGGGRWIPVNW